jgi:hypothetical protein
MTIVQRRLIEQALAILDAGHPDEAAAVRELLQRYDAQRTFASRARHPSYAPVHEANTAVHAARRALAEAERVLRSIPVARTAERRAAVTAFTLADMAVREARDVAALALSEYQGRVR